MPKHILRTAVLGRRKGLAPEEADALSHQVQRTFLAQHEYAYAATIALYAPIHNEVGTALVLQESLSRGKTVLYPKVAGATLEFHRVQDLSDLRRGAFGILEPHGALSDPAEADIIVVPGVAFDKEGRRVGYGKGFYDRALHHLEQTGRLVGFCYDFQLVDEIAGEPHDVTMDLIVTETRTVRIDKNIVRG